MSPLTPSTATLKRLLDEVTEKTPSTFNPTGDPLRIAGREFNPRKASGDSSTIQ